MGGKERGKMGEGRKEKEKVRNNGVSSPNMCVFTFQKQLLS